MTGEVNPKLIAVVDKLLDEMDSLDAENSNKALYTFEDKMKIILAATRLEGLRLKQDDGDDEGSAFRRPQGEKRESAN